MLLKRPKRPAFGYRFALLTQIRDFLDSPCVGHGSQNLSMNFFILNLLAFFMHQIFELSDKLYQRARSKFGARLEYWNQLRCTFRILIFNSWEDLLIRIIGKPIHPPP
jgi:hypothetical protein